MKSSLLAIALFVGTSFSTGQFATAQTQLVAVGPTLRFVTVSDYAFGIAGMQWGNRMRVTVTLHANRQVERVIVQATKAGSFLIGVSTADLCQTTTVQARDRMNHRKTLHGPNKSCLVILEASPHITVLQGKLMATPIHT